MRPVNAASARRHMPERRPPPPPWLRPLVMGLVGVLAVALAAAALVVPARTGAWAALGNQLGNRVVELSRHLDLVVERVVTFGAVRTPEEKIRQILAMDGEQSILEVDVSAARQRLEDLPWIKQATVNRRLPDSIHVQLEEARPMALWETGGEVRLIDTAGDVIPLADLGAFEDLPRVRGEGAPGRAWTMLDHVASHPELEGRLEALELVDGRRWTLTFRPGVEVLLPAGKEAVALTRLARLQAERDLFGLAISRIDLRLPSRLVLTPLKEEVQTG